MADEDMADEDMAEDMARIERLSMLGCGGRQKKNEFERTLLSIKVGKKNFQMPISGNHAIQPITLGETEDMRRRFWMGKTYSH